MYTAYIAWKGLICVANSHDGTAQPLIDWTGLSSPECVFEMMHKAGKNYNQIAHHLNPTGFQTARGCAFQATQVRRLLERMLIV